MGHYDCGRPHPVDDRRELLLDLHPRDSVEYTERHVLPQHVRLAYAGGGKTDPLLHSSEAPVR